MCLPELYRTPYFCQTEDHAFFELAEPVPGPTTEALARVAKDAGVAVVVPIFERRAPGVYHNTAVILDADGALRGPLPQDAHPRRPALLREVLLHARATSASGPSTPGLGRIGVLICWDQWYPEAARLTALHGADVLFYPTAIGWHPSEKDEHGAAQRAAWETIQRSPRHRQRRLRRGGEPRRPRGPAEGGDGLEFWGTSFVADPFGIVIAEASTDREEILVGEVRPRAASTRCGRNWPFLRDRRIDAYGGIDRRFLDRE